MSDTSLIFNVIARDSGIGRMLDGIANKFKGVGRDAEESLAKAGAGTERLDRQIAEAQGRVRALSEEFARTGDRTLFPKMSRDRALISQLQRIRTELHNTSDDSDRTGSGIMRLAERLQGAGSAAAGFGGSLLSAGGSAASALTSIGGMIAAAAGVGFAMIAAAPAIYAFGGAAAALPGLLSGAIAAIFTLKLGMGGLAENWKAMTTPKAGGGGGGSAKPIDRTPMIRAVEAAQRSVAKTSRDIADADVDLKDAQLAVAKSFDIARERLEDLDREYRKSKVDQMEAAQGLVEAEQQLRLAQGRGNPDEIAKAQMAVDKQRLAVEEATDRTEDLGKENTDAARKGVQGSDEVVSARRRETEAQRRVADAVQAHKLAIQSLSDAQNQLKKSTDQATAGAGGMGVVLPRIAASAQEFLDKLKQLKPAFDALRLEVQQRLFAGLADKLQILAERWLPALRIGLGRMADTLNSIVKTAFDSLSQPEFIKNMMVGLEAFRGWLGKIGRAIAGPLVDAWGRLTRASAPFITMLGDKISGLIVKFADWIKRMDETGALDRFMAKATHIFGTIFDMATDLARIAGDLIRILFGTKLGGTDAWDNLAIAIHKLADWLGDPKVQENATKFVEMFGGIVFQIGRFLAFMDEIPGRIRSVGDWFQALPKRVGTAMASLPGMIAHWASAAIGQLGYWIGYGIGWAIKQFLNFPGNVARAIKALPGVFRNISTWLINAVSNLYPWMLSTGKNIVIGIWNGIANMAGWLYRQTANFAANIWKGVKSALGIGSPSRVMASEVGHWIPAGIALGMDRNRGVVQDAIGRIAADLAGSDLAAPAVAGMEAAMGTAAGTLTVAARQQRVDVRTVLDVTGQEGKFKTFVRGLARTDNLYQTQGA